MSRPRARVTLQIRPPASRRPLMPRILERWPTAFDGQPGARFVGVLQRALTWDPADRVTADAALAELCAIEPDAF